MAPEDGSAAVGEGEFVVTGGEAAPLLVFVEASFDDVAALVVLDVVADRAPASGAATPAVPLLIRRFGDHRDDPAFAQVGADRAGRVRLVSADPGGAGARPARPAPGDAEVIHQDREHRCVTCLTGTDEDDQRQTAAVDEVMDLRAQSAS